MSSGIRINLDDFTPAMTKRLNEIYRELISDYTRMVDTVTEKFLSEFYWPFTAFTSRNVNLSSSLCEISRVVLCLEILKGNKTVNEIQTSSKSIYKVLNRYVRENFNANPVKISLRMEQCRLRLIRNELSAFLSVLFFLKEQLSYKKHIMEYFNEGYGAANLKGKVLRFLQTDIFSKNLESSDFELRDFKGIAELSDVDFYVFPYLFINTKMTNREFIRRLAAVKKYKFVFREQFLCIYDYLKIFSFRTWCRGFRLRKLMFHGIDISPIVQADIRSCMNSTNCFYGLLDYICMKRMAKADLRIGKIVGWYEGQPSSLGMFYGYRKFFPNGKSLGYVGYPMDETMFHLAPSKAEVESCLGPEFLGVISPLSKDFLTYFGKMDSLEVPCFRMRNPGRILPEKLHNEKVLLVTLPYLIDECNFILGLLEKCEDVFISHRIKVLFKNHPVHADFNLANYSSSFFSFEFSFVSGSIYDVIDDTDMLLSATSGSVYEAAMYGKKVMVAVCPKHIYQTYLPKSWNRIGYNLIFDEDDLIDTMTSFEDTLPHNLNFSSLRLYQPDAKNVHDLLT